MHVKVIIRVVQSRIKNLRKFPTSETSDQRCEPNSRLSHQRIQPLAKHSRCNESSESVHGRVQCTDAMCGSVGPAREFPGQNKHATPKCVDNLLHSKAKERPVAELTHMS